MELSDKETKILRHLSKHAKATRTSMVQKLSEKGSKWAAGKTSGSNGAAPMIFAWWTRKLVDQKLIRECLDTDGRYSHHEITAAGQKALARAQSPEKKAA